MELYCKICNHCISSMPLAEIETEQLNYGDEEELIETAKFVRVEAVDFNFGVPIDFLVNSKSLNLIDHEDPKRLIGCCGPSNFGAFNQVCPRCKHEIGVISGDCWMPHFTGVSLQNVSPNPLWTK